MLIIHHHAFGSEKKFRKLTLILSSDKNVKATLLRPLDRADIYLRGYRLYESVERK
jgi:hypothetical protein